MADSPYDIKTSMTVGAVIDFLNSLLLIDRGAVTELVGARVLCNDSMANHPSVQVSADPNGKNAAVGFLGVLNGIFGADYEGWGQIMIEFDDDTNLIQKFVKTSPVQRKWGSCLL